MRCLRTLGVMGFLLVMGVASSGAESPRPPEDVHVEDVPNDDGTALKLTWSLSLDDVPDADPTRVVGYRLQRSMGDAEWETVTNLPPGSKEFVDPNCRPGTMYRYSLATMGPADALSEVVLLEPITPVIAWFNGDKQKLCLVTLLVCGGLIISTELARRGKPVYIRPIAGLKAIEEAVGRATEMGRPMLYVPGLMDLNEIQNVVGVTVLSHVAEIAAKYDMQIDVPANRSLVMTAAQEAVQAGCLAAGRQDVYDPNRIYYVTDEQFGFVAHVCGRMLREKPAACFYIGQFFAESLLLSETGNSIGAIQIAGTAEAAQMPFFVAACDYALIGEEMFAASAYLSREPEELGMLRGQDVAKLMAGVAIVLGCLWMTAQVWK